MNKNVFDLKCKFCRLSFRKYVSPKQQKTSGMPKFCSIECSNKSRAMKKKICPMCKTKFVPVLRNWNRKRKIFCSVACSKKADNIGIGEGFFIPDTYIDIIKEYYPSGNIEYIISKTGFTKQKIQNIAYKNGIRLDKDIYYEAVHKKAREYMLENNPMFDLECIEKVKKYWMDHPDKKKDVVKKMILARQKYQKKYGTKLEKKCIKLLNELGIKYEYLPVIKENFIVDFRIGKLIIQTDGDYWHGHSRFNPLTDRQKAQKKRDAAQDKYLSVCGYKIIRIWESDLDKDVLEKILHENKQYTSRQIHHRTRGILQTYLQSNRNV